MLSEEFHNFFKIINAKHGDENKIHKQLESNDQFTNFAIPVENLSEHDRKVFGGYMKWLSLQMMRVSIKDKQKGLTNLITFQTDVIATLFRRQRWMFTELVNYYISILKECLNNTEIIFYNPEDCESLSEFTNVGLKISNDAEFCKIAYFCIYPISSIIPLCIEVKKSEINELRDVAYEILRVKSIECKCVALEFFGSYFEFSIDFDSSFLIAILQTLSIIIRDLQVVPTNSSNSQFFVQIERIFTKINASDAQLKNHYQLEKFVTFSREIFTNLQRLKVDKQNVEENLVKLVEKFLDSSDFSDKVVANLKKFTENDDIMVLSLLKYPIVLEVLKASNRNVIEGSQVWRKVHEMFMKNLENFPTQGTSLMLFGCLVLAVQVEFMVTQLHQTRQANLTGSTCNEQVELNFFTDYSEIVKKLIDYVKNTDVTDNEVLKQIMKLQSFHGLDNEMKNSLYSILITLPFKEILDNDQILSSLPENFKTKLSQIQVSADDLTYMRIDTFLALSQLPLKQSDTFWIKILNFAKSNSSQQWKNVLRENILNFIVNCQWIPIEYFQEIFVALDPVLKLPLKEILCFQLDDENVKVVKRRDGNEWKYAICCPLCSPINKKLPCVSIEFRELHNNWKIFKFEGISDNSVSVENIAKIQEILRHSKIDRDFIAQDNGKIFFEQILISDENFLKSMQPQFEQILDIVKEICKGREELVLKNCHLRLFQLTTQCVYRGPETLQFVVLKLIQTLSLSLDKSDESNFSQCFQLFLYYIVIDGSHMKGPAAVGIFEMCKLYQCNIDHVFIWFKTFMLSKIATMLMYNVVKFNISMMSSFADMRKRLNLPRNQNFLPFALDIIIATCIPSLLKSSKVLENLRQLCIGFNSTIGDQIRRNITKVYHEVYCATNSNEQLLRDCKNFIEQEIRMTMRECYSRNAQVTTENVLIYFNKSPNFVIEVIGEMIGDPNTQKIADDIDSRLLGVLISFENQLVSHLCEKSVKRHILKSIGDIIQFLESERISKHCFKIITILNSAVNECNIKGSEEICINVYDKLVRVCDINTLGSVLSTIFVSLECFIDHFPQQVEKIIKFLVVDNNNGLSVKLRELFFIDKTKYSDEIKQAVNLARQSQTMREFGDLRASLNTLISFMNDDNCDVKIKIYCLQQIKTYMKDYRKQLNEMICDQPMDELIKKLLLILISNCKSSNENLQIALAECLGELGAIEPNLQQQNFANLEDAAEFVTDEDFAINAMKVLCRSYQHKSDSKFLDTLSLAIQKILNFHEVDSQNCLEKEVWMTIPVKMQPLMKPLLTSQYKPKQREVYNGIIFWKKSKTLNDWVMNLATSLVDQIADLEVKSMMEHLLPSMKHNQLTTSFFLPYAVLNAITDSDDAIKQLQEEFQFVFDSLLKENSENIEEESYNYLLMKPYDSMMIAEPNPSQEQLKPMAIKVAKVIFEVFDFLEHYRRVYHESKETCNDINTLMKSFDPEVIANVNYECGEYARAMIYMEQKMRDLKSKGITSNEFQSRLNFLTKIFAKLDNIDAVKGVLAMKTSEWPLKVRIPINNIVGDLHDAAACCERVAQLKTVDSIENIQDIVNSYISLEQPKTALMIYEKLIQNIEEKDKKICAEIRAEPMWRLSRFDELEEMLDKEIVTSSAVWGVQCGELLVNFRKSECQFKEILDQVRSTLMNNLKITGSEQTAYEKNYRSFVNLHLVSDIEKAENIVNRMQMSDLDQDQLEILKHWIAERDTRLEIIQKNPQIQEPMLCFYRVVLQEIQSRTANQKHPLFDRFVKEEIGRLWIKSIKIACKNKSYQQAQAYILNAESYESKDLFLEKAELHWLQGDQHRAIKTLNLGIAELMKGYSNVEQMKLSNKRILSKAKMKIAQFNADAMNFDVATIKKLFYEADIKGAENEKIYLLTAEYLDRHYSVESDNKIAQVGNPPEMLTVMLAYYNSLTYGNDYIYQSMPRFLSIWFDTTSAHLRSESSHITDMNKLADRAASNFDPSYFYTAFSQILSRLCHQSQNVYLIIKKILTKLVEKHPQQALWYLIPMLKSGNSARKGKAKDILSCNRSLQNLINEFNTLVSHFQNLATLELDRGVKRFSLKIKAVELMKFLQTKQSQFILPFEFNLNLNRVGNSFSFHDNVVTIFSIKDNVEIMMSLQKPKKVTIIGSDGKEYPCLFKTQDDLRVDLRFMEVSSVLKGLLLRDPESRQRQLTTRTYSVIPINEKAGIIEWVPNLMPYKAIISKEYKKQELSNPHPSELEKIVTYPKQRQIDEYRRLIKNNFPPAFGDYYRERFSTPQNYYKARLAFIKSTAAWSIIGYILGLGDRHGENILIDVCTGETFHVDCNMLFNRGERLNVPETVPFRMTHNMVDAMGVLGVEGSFKKSCEIILRVLQKEKNTLLAYLRPIIYDITNKHNSKDKGEVTEQESVTSYKNVQSRLNGIATKYRSNSGIPLSVEGHVNFIIKEATDEANLAGMFRGWMPWM